MSVTTVTLHDSGGTLLLTLLALNSQGAIDAPTRNFDAVQPPGSETQGAFGDGTYQAGVLEREFALCNIGTYPTVGHAKRALDVALESTASIRTDGWELPIAAAQGARDWLRTNTELRAVIRLIPSSPFWTLIADTDLKATGLI